MIACKLVLIQVVEGETRSRPDPDGLQWPCTEKPTAQKCVAIQDLAPSASQGSKYLAPLPPGAYTGPTPP